MKLIIENYKNIPHLQIDVCNNMIILLGNNGVGKSNTLEAVYKGYYRIEEYSSSFDDVFLLNLDINHNSEDYYPHATLLDSFFPNHRNDISEEIVSFLNSAYQKIRRPLLKEVIKNASESITYSSKNKVYDPSSLAIIRLALLYKLYQQVVKYDKKYIILVDNPELYCHQLLIDEITSILLKLQKSGCLIMIATHDEHVISRMYTRFEEIIKLRKDENGNVTSESLNTEEVIKEIRQFYKEETYLTRSFSKASQADSGLNQLLEGDNVEAFLITAFRDYIITAYFSKCIILGEGASEDVLFDYIGSEINPGWISQYQVGFLSCLGKSTMPLYFILLKHLGVKVVCMFDYDKTNNPVHQAYYDAFLRYHKNNKEMFRYHYLKPDLENFLNMLPEDKLVSLIKPVNIFNFTYLHKDDNIALDNLIEILKENVALLCSEKE